MIFLRNSWYVAAWSQELASDPIGEKIIGDFVLLYRKADGGAVALGDTCPHRFAPLHRGKVIDDEIQCPYHGLRFDESGRCAHNPFDPKVKPAAANVRTYPLVERNGILWIWMGDAEHADPANIPEFGWIDDREGLDFTAFAQMTQPLNYELVIDNLMDLSHGQFLHPTTLGNEAMTEGTTVSRLDGNTVYSERFNPNGEAPTLFQIGAAAKPGERVDFWNDMRWDAPCIYYLQVGIVPTGQPREQGHYFDSAHLLTPRDETSTVYRYLLGRNFARGNPAITAGMEEVVETAFTQEDEPMIAAVQERMAGRDFWSMKPVMLKTDKGPVLVRRVMERLIASEARTA